MNNPAENHLLPCPFCGAGAGEIELLTAALKHAIATLEAYNESLGDGLSVLAKAVHERPECHKAYSDFTAAISGRFPSREERDKELALRSALGLAESIERHDLEIATANHHE